METAASQEVLVSSVKLAGPWVYYLPWGSLCSSYPTLVSLINTWVNIIWIWPNLIYQKLINPSFVEKRTLVQSKRLMELRKDFLSGKTGIFPPMEVRYLEIQRRDENMYKNVQAVITHPEYDSSKKFVICIGMLHLSLDKGILSHFESNGYTLKPAPIVSVEL
jgi:hypothetical protein